ncbi:hypothetical protein [Demequina sp. NBRC 110054]|uniref:hypothetical protein n=1 Tax=Demequina sp. NBRC 110054 TaxID=1570343 RepID=UPI001F414B7E|nr:hypothetical protein [Demequina sp. NBRC 110054]
MTRSIDLDPDNVAEVELYFYDVSSTLPDEITRTTIVTPGLIAELVDTFTEIPGASIDDPEEEIQGARATGIRFVLDDCSTVDMTQYYIDHVDGVIAWPDGEVLYTEWGLPFEDYYVDSGDKVTVDTTERPVSPLETSD